MKVTVKFAPAKSMMDFYTGADPVETARLLLVSGKYEDGPVIDLGEGTNGFDAAEEIFDLSNNPGREDERAEFYGTGRSLSVGDIVVVDNFNFLCASVGWKAFT